MTNYPKEKVILEVYTVKDCFGLLELMAWKGSQLNWDSKYIANMLEESVIEGTFEGIVKVARKYFTVIMEME